MEERLRAFLRHLDSLEEADGTEDCFSKEFHRIRKSQGMAPELSTKVGKRKENAKKNRYKDILPFDQTRVNLTLLAEEGLSDYINANFIRGVEGQPSYIATQGPLATTVIDLWRMIWEFRITVIVMACREVEHGKKKCERYWATELEPVTYGPFTITQAGEETLGAEVIIRTLSVSFHGEERKVFQFQYLAWPDHGIPGNVDGLLEMIDSVHQRQGKGQGPVCVHCSAGCGRTGVICTVDFIWNLLLTQRVSEDFGVMDIVREMRQQRPAAVQTKDQYHFVYRIVAEMFHRELASRTPSYQNWKEEADTSAPRAAADIRPPRPPLAFSHRRPSPAPRLLSPPPPALTTRSPVLCCSKTPRPLTTVPS